MTGAQLSLPTRLCSSCGSRLHDGCGYDPQAVLPVIPVEDALCDTIDHALKQAGSRARTFRPGLSMRWAGWKP